jgi:hypothetical protein
MTEISTTIEEIRFPPEIPKGPDPEEELRKL